MKQEWASLIKRLIVRDECVANFLGSCWDYVVDVEGNRYWVHVGSNKIIQIR